MYYDDSAQFSTQVSQLLHVDQSEQRAKALQHLLLEGKMRTIPYRRQDVDMVFLVAKPELARELRPLLSFYYASKIPVYATSHLYSGVPNPQLDQDLNGVMFCAIPWEIAPQTLSPDLQEILKRVQTTWPQASAMQPQFFALGVDSYRLARQIGARTLSAEDRWRDWEINFAGQQSMGPANPLGPNAARSATVNKMKRRIGQLAEQRAQAYLQQQGLISISNNYLCPGGEIDLIMRDQP